MKKYKISRIISKIFFGSMILSLFTSIFSINNKDKRMRYLRIISILSTLLSLIAAWFLSVPSKKKNNDISDEDEYDDFDIEDLEDFDENLDLETSNNQEYIKCILDKDSFTQKDIIAILKSGITLSDYRNKLIGKIVHLYNSADYRIYCLSHNFCQYVIADINHQDKHDDSTSYTPNSIDLIASGIVANINFGSISPYGGSWSTSDIRIWLNNIFKNGFDNEIQEFMSKMIVESYIPFTTLQSSDITPVVNYDTTDYIKLLSGTELNLSTYDKYMSEIEGTPYSDIFTKGAYDSLNASRIRGYDESHSNIWWTRSIDFSNTDCVWNVDTLGNCNCNLYCINISYGVIPVLRLKSV